eukprot:TRINITY_DN9353_c0_g1_i1.p1 TRINITY_DN9353_c0_g1~~TRINITY_DN9353_c0_g1_i1.p1  ORF type:complete len:1142 (+),score=314.28 TRINITY_DN9353_c0_g1_i1:24-3428(+)
MAQDISQSWYHGALNKDKAEELLANKPDGTFLVRDRNEQELVLSVNFRNKATHHLMAKSDGKWMLNKKAYSDDPTKVENIIAALKTKQPSWPVPLIHPVAKAGAKPASTNGSRATSVRRGSVSGAGYRPHKVLTKAKAEELLLAKSSDNGTALIRQREEGNVNEFILSVMFNGKATHHLLKRTAPKQPFTLNKTALECTTFNDVIKHLRVKRPFWPVPLKTMVPAAAPNGGKVSGNASRSQSVSGKPAANGSRRASSASESTKRAANPKAKGDYFHGYLRKDEAEARMLAVGKEDGVFLLRTRTADNVTKMAQQLIVSVCFKGKPTHHLLEKTDNSYKLNKTTLDVSSLDEVVRHLGTKHPYWPVPLSTPVPNPNADNSTEPEPTPAKATTSVVKEEPVQADNADKADNADQTVSTSSPSPTPIVAEVAMSKEQPPDPVDQPEPEADSAPTPEVKDTPSAVLAEPLEQPPPETETKPQIPSETGSKAADEEVHPKMPKETAESLLASKSIGDGTYLLRRKGANPNEIILSVMFKDKPSHHLISRPDKSSDYQINKKPTGGDTLQHVVKFLGRKHPFWPVPLLLRVPPEQPDADIAQEFTAEAAPQRRRRKSSTRSMRGSMEPDIKEEPEEEPDTETGDKGADKNDKNDKDDEDDYIQVRDVMSDHDDDGEEEEEEIIRQPRVIASRVTKPADAPTRQPLPKPVHVKPIVLSELPMAISTQLNVAHNARKEVVTLLDGGAAKRNADNSGNYQIVELTEEAKQRYKAMLSVPASNESRELLATAAERIVSRWEADRLEAWRGPEPIIPEDVLSASPCPAEPQWQGERHPGWYFGKLNQERAEQLLMEPPLIEGKFLVRDQLKGRPEHYILSMLENGMPSHHRIHRYREPNADNTSRTSSIPDANAPFVVDGMSTTARTLSDLIETLRKPQPLWSSPLGSDLISPAEEKYQELQLQWRTAVDNWEKREAARLQQLDSFRAPQRQAEAARIRDAHRRLMSSRRALTSTSNSSVAGVIRQLVEELDSLHARIPIARHQDDRTRAREAETKARLQDAFKPVKYARGRTATVTGATGNGSKPFETVKSATPSSLPSTAANDGSTNDKAHIPRRRFLSFSERIETLGASGANVELRKPNKAT